MEELTYSGGSRQGELAQELFNAQVILDNSYIVKRFTAGGQEKDKAEDRFPDTVATVSLFEEV